MQDSYITKEKLEELKKELEELKTVKRLEIATNLEYARSLGDLSENAEYHDAREQQAKLEERVKHLEQVIKSAKIVTHSKKTDEVRLGSAVTIRKKGERKTIVYTLVGSEEANIHEGKISFHSPIGEALLGKEVGDNFSFETPRGTQEYVVVSIG